MLISRVGKEEVIKIGSLLKIIESNILDLKSEKYPLLPIIKDDWGAIWFDEYYNENEYGDMVFPICPNLFERIRGVICANDNKVVNIVEGTLVYKNKEREFESRRMDILEYKWDSFVLNVFNISNPYTPPYYVFDDNLNWFFEFGFDGVTFFASAEVMIKVIMEFGGSKEIYNTMMVSHLENEALSGVDKIGREYISNLFKRLVELEN